MPASSLRKSKAAFATLRTYDLINTTINYINMLYEVSLLSCFTTERKERDERDTRDERHHPTTLSIGIPGPGAAN